MSFSKWPPGVHIEFFTCRLCRWHGFRSITGVCFGVSNFIYMSFVAVGRNLWIFSNGHPLAILDFGVSGLLNLVKLWISRLNFCATLLVSVGRVLVILNDIQLQSTHCCHFPLGGCILADHGFTISSFNCYAVYTISYITTIYWEYEPMFINSLWPSDTILWHRSGLTLVQVMAYHQ